ncbi:MAG TPA: hypothetical protein DEQ09_10435 [Bacteroidales bacterium]|nr:hypothetical protein [Bacteroidales bacterium]
MIIKQLSPASNAVFLRSGMAKESIVRILKDFSDEGIICSVCLDIEIIDKDKLQMISDNG